MKKTLFLIFALIASSCCLAAPSSYDNSETLRRPSPINPTIPMDPKPTEKITLITDPKELAKFKREITNENSKVDFAITAPTTVPPQKALKDEHDQPIAPSDQLKHRQKRADAVDTSTQPLIYRDQHKQPSKQKQLSENGVSVTPQSMLTPIPPPEHQTHESLSKQTEKVQSSPIYFDAEKHSEMKRDIPVPLVPKYDHPEESPKEEDNLNEENTSTMNGHSSTTTSTTTVKISTNTTTNRK